MKLSICMMVKNEEKHLEKCLTSLIPLRDSLKSELIIVDTGSEDKTVEIAKKHTENVFHHAWNNNFGEMRNITLDYAKGEWILIIDGDEALQDVQALVEFLNTSSKEYNGAYLTIKNFLGSGENYAHIIALRLLRNKPEFRYSGIIHEAPQVNGMLFHLKTVLNHYGYMWADKGLLEKKFARNTELLKAELKKDPDNILYLFYLSASYRSHEDYKEALAEIEKAYNIIKNKNLDAKEYVFIIHQLAICYINLEMFEEAKKTCLEALELDPNHLDIHYLIAKLYHKAGKLDDAIEHYTKFLHLVDNFENNNSKLVNTNSYLFLNKSDEVYLEIALIYLHKENFKHALEYARKTNPDYSIEKLYGILIECFVKTKQFSELREYYESNVSKFQEKNSLFLTLLESVRDTISLEEKFNLSKEFSKGSYDYALFSQIRTAYKNNCENLDQLIQDFASQANHEPLIYEDIIYYLISLRKPAANVFASLYEDNINYYLNILTETYDDFKIKVLEYLKPLNTPLSFQEIKCAKILEHYLLIIGNLSEQEYSAAFKNFIEHGVLYVKELYNTNIFDSEFALETKNKQESFLLYIGIAEEKAKISGLEYVNYLRKALNIYPPLSKGINILLAEYNAKLNQQQNVNNELEQYKIKLKGIINNLIDTNQLEEAKLIVDECKKILSDDPEITILEFKISSAGNQQKEKR